MSPLWHRYGWKTCLWLKWCVGLLLGPAPARCKRICWWSSNEKCPCLIVCRSVKRQKPQAPPGHHDPSAAQVGAEQLAVARMAGSWRLRRDSLCNLFLRQAAHYANTLFTVGVTVSRHESRWGLRAAAQYQERRRRWKRTLCQKERSTELPAFVLRFLYLWVSARLSKHIILRKLSFFFPAWLLFAFTCEATWEDTAAGEVCRALENTNRLVIG